MMFRQFVDGCLNGAEKWIRLKYNLEWALKLGTYVIPPGFRISFVETFVWAPAPFQSPVSDKWENRENQNRRQKWGLNYTLVITTRKETINCNGNLPVIGFGSRVATIYKNRKQFIKTQSAAFTTLHLLTPNSSEILCSKYLDIQMSSAIEIPRHGPTWYSHWAGITSALVPQIFTPA